MYHTRSGTDLPYAISLLQQDELVAIPTETVYGLAGNAFSVRALERIFEAKQRPHYNPLIVHVRNIEAVYEVVEQVPSLAIRLFEQFSPGPLTVLLPKKPVIPNLVTNGQATVGIRIPHHPLTLKLLQQLSFPLAAPSANRFKKLSPTRVEHVMAQLDGAIPYILDGGPAVKGVESTVLKIVDEKIMVYRVGAITVEQLQSLGVEVAMQQANTKLESPGMLLSHYAPETPLLLANTLQEALSNSYKKPNAIVIFGEEAAHDAARYTVEAEAQASSISFFNLSVSGNLEQASQNLYHLLYELDGKQFQEIVVVRLPDIGLGRTINDRLERAARH